MKNITLINSTLLASVDDEDFDRVVQHKWRLHQHRHTDISIGSVRSSNNNYAMANFIMDDFDAIFDHKDCDPFNNTRANLRPCTQQQNIQNKRKSIGMTSKYKGVCWGVRERRWRVTITFYGRQIYLGTFTNEIEAAKAYDAKANELFGEFARLNFPLELLCTNQ